MKTILNIQFLLWLILFPAYLSAGEKTQIEVRAAVETWVHHVTADAHHDAMVERMEPYLVDGFTVAYIVHLYGGGFCLCGADDLLLPVYIYSPQGTFDPKNHELQYFLWEIGARWKLITTALKNQSPSIQSYQTQLSARQQLWRELEGGIVPARVTQTGIRSVIPDSMVIKLTSRWHQDSPYNDQCPVLTPGSNEHTVTGCNATAMAQIMNYWKWPSNGTGSNSNYYFWRWRSNWDEEPLTSNPSIPAGWENRLQWTSTNGGQLRMTGYWDVTLLWSAIKINETDAVYTQAVNNLWNRLTHDSTFNYANFGATTYDWSLMQDVHNDPPDAGDAEVAKLCYHAGVSIWTKYGLNGSFANDANIDDAFKNFFYYDPDVLYSYPKDINSITEDIQWLRPVILGGVNDKGEGHEWVVLGYNKKTDPDRQFLMNLGWGGTNVWYSCDTISFHHQQSTVTRISPLSTVQYVGSTTPPFDGTPSNPYSDLNQAITLAPDGTKLIFLAGSDQLFTTPELIINRPLTLTGNNVTIKRNY